MRPLILDRRQAGPARGPWGILIVAAVLFYLPSGARADVPSTLQFPPTNAYAGQAGAINLESITDFGYQGFSVSAVFDPPVLAVTAITTTGTITEAIGVDFFEANIDAQKGTFVIGCLVDASPPFDERMIPGTGIPLAIAAVKFTVPASTQPSTTTIRFVNGAGDPPINNVLSVDNQSVPPDRLIDGVITILRRPIFVRGDANSDTTVDIADPVFLINFLFGSQGPPLCMDAADGNDDEAVDLADAIFILQYYFQSGLKPPAPHPNPGPDPTQGRTRDLGCLVGPF